jgi:hypothetical protein
MEMDRPHIEKIIRYYNQACRVREKGEDQRIHGEETWIRKGVILVKAGVN